VEDPHLQCIDGDKEGSFHNYQGDNSTMTKEHTKDMSMCATFSTWYYTCSTGWGIIDSGCSTKLSPPRMDEVFLSVDLGY